MQRCDKGQHSLVALEVHAEATRLWQLYSVRGDQARPPRSALPLKCAAGPGAAAMR